VPGSNPLPDWRLPRGVTRGTWEHAQSKDIARAYDERFSHGSPQELDEAILEEILRPPGMVIDLGCGAGRLALPLARRGLHCVGVDLSRSALAELSRQAETQLLPIDCLLANLVELDTVRDSVADYCIAMYSTLGMIRGRANRQQFLRHVRRVLKPGGRFVVHIHNRWSNLFQPQSRGWLIANLAQSLWRRDVEAGDKFYEYHDVPNFFLHVFTRREIARDLREAGIAVERLLPLSVERQALLSLPWLFPGVRAGGWIVICRA